MGIVLVGFAVIWDYVTQPISVVFGVAGVLEYFVASTVYGAIIGGVDRSDA